jgi:hypothetical protein
MNAEYMTIPQYVECKSKIVGKIATYDLLIESMEKALLDTLINGNGEAVGGIAEYELDDGQMKCRTRYRSTTEMRNTLNGLIRMRQYYINTYNGRVQVLRGGNL